MDYSVKKIQSRRYLFPGSRRNLTSIWVLSLVPFLLPQVFIPCCVLFLLLFTYDFYDTKKEFNEKIKNISFAINWPEFMELGRTQEFTVSWSCFSSDLFIKIFLPTEFSPRIHTLNRFQSSFKARGKRKGTYHDVELYVGHRSKLGLFVRYYKLIHERKLFVTAPILYFSSQQKYYHGKIYPQYRLGGESDFYGIRAYQFGDPIKKINWRKTAGSSSEVYVNEYEKEKSRKILIALNTGMASRFDYRKYQYTDYQTGLAFQLAHVFTKNQDETGLLTFSEEIDLYIPPNLSNRHMPTLFRHLQHIEDNYKHMDIIELYLFLRNRLQRKSILILLSPFISFEQVYSQRKAIFLLSQEYQVIWVNPARLFKYYYEGSRDLRYAWAKAHLLREKQNEDDFFRNGRLLYVNDQPEKLYQKTLNHYFSLKW